MVAPRVVSLLPSATEIVAALDLAALLVGRSHECDHPAAVTSLPVLTSSTLDGGLDAMARPVAGTRRPRVACLEWLAPPVTAGNWGPELAAIAGGAVVLARAGVHSGTIELAALAAADPDAIVIAPCSYTIARSL